MAQTVSEIMNPELFGIRPTDLADQAVRHLLALGVSGAPVLDQEGRPLGVASVGDLLREDAGLTAADRMTSPPAVVAKDASLAQAASQMAETGYGRLVVVDAGGKAVGLVSAIDVLRALTGAPVRHPDSFPHYDRTSGLTWTDDTALDLDRVQASPDGPGLLLLVHGGAQQPEIPVWAEACANVRTRLLDMLSTPQGDRPALLLWLQRGNLRFRAAAEPDSERRRFALRALQTRIRHRREPAPPP